MQTCSHISVCNMHSSLSAKKLDQKYWLVVKIFKSVYHRMWVHYCSGWILGGRNRYRSLWCPGSSVSSCECPEHTHQHLARKCDHGSMSGQQLAKLPFCFLTYTAESVNGKREPNMAAADVGTSSVGAYVLTQVEVFITFMNFWELRKLW